jgi:phosphoglycolate phosphatase-like HAD superfamily hydrolase
MTTKNQGLVAVFDVDGTLIDSGMKLKTDALGAFQRLGVQVKPEQLNGDWYAFASQYGISEKEFDREFDKRKSWEQSLRDGEAPLFPDTIPCLESLKARGVRLAVLSRSVPKYTLQKLDYHNLRNYFEHIEVVDPKAASKASGALNLVSRLGPETISRAFFIGDREEDVNVIGDVSQNYEIDTRGVHVSRNHIILPTDYQVNSLGEVPELVR